MLSWHRGGGSLAGRLNESATVTTYATAVRAKVIDPNQARSGRPADGIKYGVRRGLKNCWTKEKSWISFGKKEAEIAAQTTVEERVFSMSGTTAKKSTAWFGFLDAGEKSSAVALDPGLDTGNASTMYLFNLRRNSFLEYRRDLVEPKLRALDGEDEQILNELQAAYMSARAGFAPRGGRSAIAVERPRTRKTTSQSPPEDDGVDTDEDDIPGDGEIADDEGDWDADDS
jgi:hypothetical protein